MTVEASASRLEARRGRPSDAAKHAAILAAAQLLFTRNGYAATGMDAIAALAGVSKLTVYRHFNTKAALFAAAIAAKCRTMLLGLDRLELATVSADAALAVVGAAFLGLILHPEALAVHRLVASERAHAPELGALFYAHAVKPTNERVAAMIAMLVARDELHGDPELIAGDFLALLRSKPLLHLDVGVAIFDDAELAAHIDHSIGVIRRAYR